MNEEILINVTPQETRVAVMQQGVVQELHIERGSQRGLVGNVYVGKVKRVLPGMQSAFIDIGLERSAFLHVADIWENRINGDAAKPIEKVLFEGQSVLAQVIKDPIGSKGARLSTQLSFAGRLLVYLPQEAHIGVSQRIERCCTRNWISACVCCVISWDRRLPASWWIRATPTSACRNSPPISAAPRWAS